MVMIAVRVGRAGRSPMRERPGSITALRRAGTELHSRVQRARLLFRCHTMYQHQLAACQAEFYWMLASLDVLCPPNYRTPAGIGENSPVRAIHPKHGIAHRQASATRTPPAQLPRPWRQRI